MTLVFIVHDATRLYSYYSCTLYPPVTGIIKSIMFLKIMSYNSLLLVEKYVLLTFLQHLCLILSYECVVNAACNFSK